MPRSPQRETIPGRMPRPRKPPTERYGVRVPIHELAHWHEVALAEGVDLADIVRRAVRAEIKRIKRSKPKPRK